MAVPPNVDDTPSVVLNRWDHVRRYTSARELFDFPLAVIVGLSESEQLAAADARVNTYLRRAAGAIVSVIASLAGL